METRKSSLTWLSDTFALQSHCPTIQVGQVAFEAKEGLSSRSPRENLMQSFMLGGTHLVNSNSLFPVETALLSPKAAALFLGAHSKDDVASIPFWALVTLTLEHDFVTLRHALDHVQRVMLCVINDLLALAMRTSTFDDLSTSTALVAGDLTLRKHSREDLCSSKLGDRVSFWMRLNVPVV